MCGRYLRRSDKQRIAEAFRLKQLPEGFVLPPDFNIAPSTFQPINLHDGSIGRLCWVFRFARSFSSAAMGRD